MLTPMGQTYLKQLLGKIIFENKICFHCYFTILLLIRNKKKCNNQLARQFLFLKTPAKEKFIENGQIKQHSY
jgi:hypothetical protein